MKNKFWIWTVTIISAIPLPFSLISILGSIISIANIGVTASYSVVLAIVAVISMILAGTYSITYIASTFSTFRRKKLTIISFLPVFHILIAIVFFVAWFSLEKIYL